MAYVYRHIRLDKNVPFYIGVGLDNEGKYKRANNTINRNKHWHNVVNKSNYEVEIIIDDIEWQDALSKEVEFIKIYGRKQFGGLLVNLTDGGEGNSGYITSEETKKKQSLLKKGKPSNRKGMKQPQRVIDAVIKAHVGKSPWNKGLPQSTKTAEKIRISMEGRYLKGESHPMYRTKMPQYLKEKLRLINTGKPTWNKGMKGQYKTQPSKLKKAVIKYDLSGNYIQEYDSATDAANKNTGSTKAGISWCALGNIKNHFGFVWEYK